MSLNFMLVIYFARQGDNLCTTSAKLQQ